MDGWMNEWMDKRTNERTDMHASKVSKAGRHIRQVSRKVGKLVSK